MKETIKISVIKEKVKNFEPIYPWDLISFLKLNPNAFEPKFGSILI